MMTNGSDIDEGAVLQATVCIVGAGPAGITIALRLADEGIPVVLLEAGGDGYDARAQSMMEGSYSGERAPPLHETRMSALGGSTSLWAGWCRPFDKLDFEKRPGLSMSGWPFSRDELEEAYDQAHEVIGLGKRDPDPLRLERRLRPALTALPPATARGK